MAEAVAEAEQVSLDLPDLPAPTNPSDTLVTGMLSPSLQPCSMSGAFVGTFSSKARTCRNFLFCFQVAWVTFAGWQIVWYSSYILKF